MAAKTLLDRLNIAIENASNPKTQVRRKGSYMDYDDTEERVISKKQIALLDAAKREEDRVKAEPRRKKRKAEEDTAINKFAKEQAAADADPDVAAMEEQGGMEGLDFSVMGEKGLSALRGKEYADEIEGQEKFDELVPGDFTDMGRTDAMKEAASEEFGGEFPDTSKSPSEPMGNVTTVVAEPEPVGGKARFDGADILDEADIARRAEVPEETLAALFRKTHGGPFDPKSKMDKAKMATITSMIGENRDLLNLSPTQFALKVYARKK